MRTRGFTSTMPPVWEHSYSKASTPCSETPMLPGWRCWPVPAGEELAREATGQRQGVAEADTDGLARDLLDLGMGGMQGMEVGQLEEGTDRVHQLVKLGRAARKAAAAKLARQGVRGGVVQKPNLHKRGQVEVLKFRSVRLEAGGKLYLCPLTPCTFSCSREAIRVGRAAVHLTQEHGLKVETAAISLSPSSYSCPLPGCPFLTSWHGLLCGHASLHLVREHGLTQEQVLASSVPQWVLRFRRREEARSGLEEMELEQLLLTLQL